jgi:hypothetical protein
MRHITKEAGMLRIFKALIVAVVLAIGLATPALHADATCSISITGVGGWQWDFASSSWRKAVMASIVVGPGNQYLGADVYTNWSNGGYNYWYTTGSLSTNDSASYSEDYVGTQSVTLSAYPEAGASCSQTAYFSI